MRERFCLRVSSAVLAALGAVVLWASLATLARAIPDWPPFELTGVALLVGALVGVPRVHAWRVPWRTLLLGVVGLVGFHATLFFALQGAPAVEVALLSELWPSLLVLLAPVLVPGTRLRGGHLVGTACGLVGAFLVVTEGHVSISATHMPGYILGFLAALVWAVYSLLLKRVPPFPDAAVGLFCAVSGVVSLGIHAVVGPAYVPRAAELPVVVLIGLGPMGLSFFLWNHAVIKGDPRTIGALSLLTPLLSSLFLIVVGGASLKAITAVGGALIVGGAAIGARAGHGDEPAPEIGASR